MNKWIATILVIFPFFLFAQINNFSYYDKETYRLYNKQQWDSLIILGNEALNNNYDYYYLRMRIGIANYSQKNFYNAIEHFKKALEFDTNDVVLEYLYYSYLFSGYRRDAQLLTKIFSEQLLKKLYLIKLKNLEWIDFYYTSSFITNWDSIKKINTPPDNNKNYQLDKQLSGKYTGYNAGFNLNLSKYTSLYTNVSFFEINNYQQLFYNYQIKHENNFKLNDYHEYSAITFWKKNKSTTLFAHFNLLRGNLYEYKYKNTLINHLNIYNSTYVFDIYPTSINNLSFALGLAKSTYYKNYYVTWSALYATINKTNLLSLGFDINYSLSRKCYGETQALLSKPLAQEPMRAYAKQQITFISKYLNVGISFLYGKIYQQVSFDGFIMYTSPETINWDSGLFLKININKHLSWEIIYHYQYLFYDNPFKVIYKINNFNQISFNTINKRYYFYNQIINGGLIWKL